MQKQGGNGKVIIDKEKKTATKILKNSRNDESKNRFINEMHVLKAIQGKSQDAIVEILDIDEENMQITMKAYDGDLESIYEETRGNVKNTIQLILPIVKALKGLSEMTPPIFHRDIKPQNILVENINGTKRLVLADFGCAYMEESDRRLTDDFRAVGAQMYRAPEYQYGRVDEVDEKGDIFSIGKVLWNLLNGNPREVFPYTLWFPKEYNLRNRFPDTVELLSVNNLIGACVNYDKNKRPSYGEMIDEMENIINGVTKSYAGGLREKAIEFEARRTLTNKENEEKILMFLERFFTDFGHAIDELSELLNLELLNRLKAIYYGQVYLKNQIKKTIIEGCSECGLLNIRFEDVYFSILYRSKTVVTELTNIPGVDNNLPYIHTFYGGGQVKRNSMSIFFRDGLLFYKKEGESFLKYDGTVWMKYLEEFVERYMNFKDESD